MAHALLFLSGMKYSYLILLGLFFYSSTTFGSSRPLFDASDLLIEDFSEDLPLLSNVVNRAAIVSFTHTDSVEEDLREYIIKNLESRSAESDAFEFIQCKDCFLIRAESQGDRVVVKKGLGTKAELEKKLSELGTKHYVEINFSNIGARASLTINVYRISKSDVVWGKTYHTRVLNRHNGFFWTVTAMSGVASGVESTPLGVSVMGTQRIYGLGHMGVFVMPVIGDGELKTSVHLGPRLEANLNELLFSPWEVGSLYLAIHLGVGIYGGEKELLFGGGVKQDVGSVFHVSVDVFSAKAGAEAEGMPTLILFGFGFSFD